MADEPEPLLREQRGAVLLITLNRPQVRNAFNAALAHALAGALDALDGDDALHAGVVTGAGPGFCAGMDLKAFVGGELPIVEGRGFGGMARFAARKPLIAAVEGFAVAGGLELALACDLIVAAEGARLGLPEVKRSLVAGAGGLMRLPQRLPFGIAMEMTLTGEPISAERAHELGLVNRLCAPGAAVQTALELAGAVAANGPLALTASKEILYRQRDLSAEEFWELQDPIVAQVGGSQDAIEGATAFAEKRPPVWRGR
ncbi:MAG TPA: crotonase/enoyl-CoA hydratase family protein [Solirubrobacteraceae bacterium]|jgi:enoyl-CoA hydratase|nr:crotonase/enoyl-CoA hydratase family protein [Solirubrobacteraceae bacterium]